MSASDSNGYFVELGEYNLIIARATLGQRPKTIEAVQELWLGDTAAIDTALGEIRPAGSGSKAIALLRLKAHSTFLADSSQGKSITTPDGVEGFLKTHLGAENVPASWAWVNASNGQTPHGGGSRWALDAASAANAEEALGKLRGWSFELVRCQSAPLTLAGGLVTAVHGAPVLLLEVSETNTTLIAISNQGITALATVPVGFDALAGATQTALGLKFRGSAARLMFNESYDFGETASSIVEPLASAVKGSLSSLGNPAPTQLVCGGVLARQTWITQSLAKALNLTPFVLDAAAWGGSKGVSFGSGVNVGTVSSSWLSILNAVASYEPATPGASKAWNPLLSGTPVASAQAIPAIIGDAPKSAVPTPAAKPAVIPAIIQEPAKAAVKPAVIPAIIQGQPKTSAPAKPSTPAIQPKPAVIITPPSKPVEPPKPAIIPAKSGTTVIPPQSKPFDPKSPAKAGAIPARPAPNPVSLSRAPGKSEPPKPSPSSKPAPAPMTGAKPATAAPFPPKKNNLPLIIGVAALLVLGIGGYFVYSSHEKETQRIAEVEQQKKRAAEEAAARRATEEKLKAEEDARKKADETARLQAIAAQEALRKAEQDTAKSTTERLINARGNLVIATKPAGATIVVGELGQRTSPLSIKDLRLGHYAVTITLNGYDSEHRDVEIKENETTDLGTIELKRQVGTIELTSEPSSLPYEIKPAGSLFINPGDLRTGQTPVTLTGVPVGSYQVTITRSNWPVYTSTITVERDGTANVHGEFAGGTVVITSTPSGSTVLRDNQTSVGTTPLTLNGIPPGQLSYTINQRGYDPVVVTGKLESGKTLSLNATLLDTDRVMKLSELDEKPSPISQADPELTPTQRVEGGTALISLVVGRDGIPTDLKVEQASSANFGKACVAAAAKWRFRPGVVHGKPAKSRVSIPFKIGPE